MEPKQKKKSAETDYLKSVLNDALEQYSDYFESEGAEGLETLKKAQPAQLSELVASYTDYSRINSERDVSKRNNFLGIFQYS